jgi:predicted DNA-binding protein (MmcQ/YjbR family)
MARLKWVYTDDPAALSDTEAAGLLQRSYELAFMKLTKKLQREIGEQA